jgi:hypothetical protein
MEVEKQLVPMLEVNAGSLCGMTVFWWCIAEKHCSRVEASKHKVDAKNLFD